ncbi:MAG: ABC transporter ATP-binding protein [Eubacteriales bacterium]|nr:ABC transporter ATP-binding protein [Eubacteriales bacterium]
MLKVNNVAVFYEDKKALDNISFSVGKGEWLMLLGANGAGKTSLIKTLCRELSYKGEITLLNKDIRKYKNKAYARSLGVLSQLHNNNTALNVKEVVSLGRYSYTGVFAPFSDQDTYYIDQAIETVGLKGYENRPMYTLSGGEQQRAYLAQVFAQNPKVLLLDEPVNSLDLYYTVSLLNAVKTWLKQGERCVISAMHDVGLAAKYGEKCLLLKEGQVSLYGDCQEVLFSKEINEAYKLDVRKTMREQAEFWL